MVFARADFVNAFNLCHFFSDAATDVYDQSEQHSDEDRLQDKLPSVDVAGHDEERSVGIVREPEKTASASAVRRKHQREQDSDYDCKKCSLHQTVVRDSTQSAVSRKAS
jgi:hypothetical protein